MNTNGERSVLLTVPQTWSPISIKNMNGSVPVVAITFAMHRMMHFYSFQKRIVENL